MLGARNRDRQAAQHAELRCEAPSNVARLLFYINRTSSVFRVLCGASSLVARPAPLSSFRGFIQRPKGSVTRSQEPPAVSIHEDVDTRAFWENCFTFDRCRRNPPQTPHLSRTCRLQQLSAQSSVKVVTVTPTIKGRPCQTKRLGRCWRS